MKAVRVFVIGLVLLLGSAAVFFLAKNTNPGVEEISSDQPELVDHPGAYHREMVNQQEAALQLLIARSTVPVEVDFEAGFPILFRGRVFSEGSNPVERAVNFLETYQEFFILSDPDLHIQPSRIVGTTGEEVVFYQTYKGLPVKGGEIVVSLDGEHVISTIGSFEVNISLDTTPLISSTDAEAIARQTKEIPGEIPVEGRTTLLVYKNGEIEGPDHHLGWEVNLGGRYPNKVTVDAQSGNVLSMTSLLGSSQPWLIMDSLGKGDMDYFSMYQTCNGIPEDINLDFFVGNQSWFNPAYSAVVDGADSWIYMTDTIDFYENFPAVPILMNTSNYGLAVPIQIFINDPIGPTSYHNGCNKIYIEPGWVSYEILVHEYTHSVIYRTSGIEPWYPLNEHFADIMAALADGNWTVGENRTGFADPYRDISNPPAFNHPDHMDDKIQGMDIHAVAGIPNKAAYLIAEGGNHYGITITGIGREKMGQLLFATMITLPTDPDLIDARNSAVGRADFWAAKGTAGFTEFDACQVKNAYASVGLGEPDLNCDGTDDPYEGPAKNKDLDWLEGADDNCALLFNPDQRDSDRDGLGDACDEDIDNDEIPNDEDLCPYVFNLTNGIWEECAEPETEDTREKADNCPDHDDDDQTDSDHDGLGNPCDPDDDNDGYADTRDNCPLTYNPEQADWDKDGVGASCDPDEKVYLQNAHFNLSLELIKPQIPVLLVPLPSCLPECLDFSIPDFMFKVILTGLPDGVTPSIVRQDGATEAAPQGLNDARILTFFPRGGEKYFLKFFFNPDYLNGEKFSFNFSLEFGPASQLLEPISSAPPLPEPDRCSLFDSEEISLTLFDIQPGAPFTQRLYFETPDGWPGVEIPMGPQFGNFEYTVELGGLPSTPCVFTGYEGQLHCAVEVSEGMIDSAQELFLRVNNCPEAIFHHGWVSILGTEADPVCHADLDQTTCEALGGTFYKVSDTATVCDCSTVP